MRAVWGWKGGVWGSAPSCSFRIRGTEWRSWGYEGWRGGKQWIVGKGTEGYCQHCVGHQWSHYFSKGGYLVCRFVLLLLCRIKMCVLTTICGKFAFCLVHRLCRNSHTLCIFHIISPYNFKLHIITAAGLLLYCMSLLSFKIILCRLVYVPKDCMENVQYRNPIFKSCYRFSIRFKSQH